MRFDFVLSLFSILVTDQVLRMRWRRSIISFTTLTATLSQTTFSARFALSSWYLTSDSLTSILLQLHVDGQTYKSVEHYIQCVRWDVIFLLLCEIWSCLQVCSSCGACQHDSERKRCVWGEMCAFDRCQNSWWGCNGQDEIERDSYYNWSMV